MPSIKSFEDDAYSVNTDDLLPLVDNAGTTPKSVTPGQVVTAGNAAAIKAHEDAAYSVNLDDLLPVVNNGGTVPKSVTPAQLITAVITNRRIYVSDTSLSDHGDAATEGTIAYALAALAAAGGGVCILAPGTFTVTSAALAQGANVRISGAGKGSTIIDQNHATSHGIEIDSGVDYTPARAVIEHLSIEMPTTGTPGDAINIIGVGRGGESSLRDLYITGGAATSWGITNNGCNQTNIHDVYINGNCNGFRLINLSGTINYGDCFVHGLEVTLDTNNTTGILLQGTANATVNNIMFGRTEIKVVNSRTGCTGVNLAAYCARNSFIQTDLENCATSISIGASTVLDNTFINPIHIGSGTPFSLTGAPFMSNPIIGGDADFRAYETHQAKGKSNITLNSSTALTYEDHAGKMIVNSGATGAITLTLPAADNDYAFEFDIHVNTAQPVTIALSDGADRIIDPNGVQRTSWTSTGVQGEFIRITNCNYRNWAVVSQIGTWS